MTEDRRYYLDTCVCDTSAPVFILINCWDNLLHRSEDENRELKLAERRDYFRYVLTPYFSGDGTDRYERGVFETSALQAIRTLRRDESLEGSGIPALL